MKEEEKINKDIIPFKREDWLRQPNSIARMGFRMELVQLRAFTRYLEELEPMFLELIDLYNQQGADKKKKISILQTQAAQPYINDDHMLEIKIKFDELNISPAYYGRARDSLKKMSKLFISYPVYDKNGDLEELSGSAFYVRTKPENGLQRCNYVRISMVKSALDFMVDIRMGYHDQLKRIAFLAKSIYTARLYWMITGRWRKGSNKLEISLKEFRDFMNLYKKDSKGNIISICYKRYCDLESRVLKPAIEELKAFANEGNSDFWVEIERKDIGENQNPSTFIITIHESQAYKITQKERQKEEVDKELQNLLVTGLNQPKSNISSLLKKVTPSIRTEFIAEVNKLSAFMKQRTDIQKPVSYSWTILNSWLDDRNANIEDVEPIEEQPQPQKPAQPVQQELFPEMKKVEDPRWDKFVEVIKSSVPEPTYETWFSAMEFVSEHDGVVKVGIPTQFIGEYIEKNLQKEFQDSIAAAFTNCTEIEYLTLKK